MDQYQCISSAEALALLANKPLIVDIRDEESFKANHILDAQNLSNEKLADFLNRADMDQPVIVCCYHGISSQTAAQFLIEQGFDQVYSLNGGFQAWHADYPEHCAS